MTDEVQLIRAEIERCYNNNIYGHTAYSNGKCSAFREVLTFIDSLPEEPASEDLHTVAKEYANIVTDKIGYKIQLRRAVIYGAQWNKEQMMAKAIEAVVSQVPCSNEIIFYNPSSVDKYYLPQEMNKLGLNKGDKVKVIIIKED